MSDDGAAGARHTSKVLGKRKKFADEKTIEVGQKHPAVAAAGGAMQQQQQQEEQEDDEHPPGDEWTQDIHRSFVSAIFDSGLAQASPSILLENMAPSTRSKLTSERVKSHLQKYRKNAARSTEEFLSQYDSFLQSALVVGSAAVMGSSGEHKVALQPQAMLQAMGRSCVAGGEAAALLSFLDMRDTNAIQGHPSHSIDDSLLSLVNGYDGLLGDHVRLPCLNLSKDEKTTALGMSMIYISGLVASFSQHILQERGKRSEGKALNAATVEDQSHPLAGSGLQHAVSRESQASEQGAASAASLRYIDIMTNDCSTRVSIPPPGVQIYGGPVREAAHMTVMDQYQGTAVGTAAAVVAAAGITGNLRDQNIAWTGPLPLLVGNHPATRNYPEPIRNVQDLDKRNQQALCQPQLLQCPPQITQQAQLKSDSVHALTNSTEVDLNDQPYGLFHPVGDPLQQELDIDAFSESPSDTSIIDNGSGIFPV